jgi:hypothetical protein
MVKLHKEKNLSGLEPAVRRGEADVRGRAPHPAATHSTTHFVFLLPQLA